MSCSVMGIPIYCTEQTDCTVSSTDPQSLLDLLTHLSIFSIPGLNSLNLGHDPTSKCISWASAHGKLPEEKVTPMSARHSYNVETAKIRREACSPEELVNARLTEGASEQSKFHLACVDGGHGRVAKSANAQRRLQLHLSTSFSPQPADEGE